MLASGASGEDIVPGRSCWFECGTVKGLLNIGNTRSQKWVCGPCNGSRRGLDNQARGNAQVKRELDRLKNAQQSEYKRKVRSARIVSQDELDRGVIGVTSRGDRREVHTSFRSEVVASVSVNDSAGVMWPNRWEWIWLHKDRYAMTDHQAIEKWDNAVATYPDHCKRGSGPGLRMAFQDIPRTDGVASRGVKRSLEQIGVVDTQGDFDHAARMVSTGQIGRHLTDAEFAEVGGNVFRSNPALLQEDEVASASAQTAAIQPRGTGITQMQMSDSDRHPVAAQSGPLEPRALRPVASDPANPLSRTAIDSVPNHFMAFVFATC